MGASVLVIDDSRIQRFFLSGIFKKFGVRAEFANGAEEGISLSFMKSFDLIFMDNLMVGMDGPEAVLKMREGLGNPNVNTPVILLCEDGQGSPPPGFVDVLRKPVEYRLLYEDLTRFLPRDKQEGLINPNAASVVGSGQGAGGDPAPVSWNTQGGGHAADMSAGDVEEQGFELGASEIIREAGLDIEKGVQYCGSEEGYLEALEIFYKTIAQKADEIEGYFNNKELESYTIKVHALKSSSRIIGASELSELAARLEQAGKEEDLALIKKKTGDMLEDYRSYKKKLRPIFEKTDDIETEQGGKPEISVDMMKDAYSSIRDFADQMDYSLVDMVLKSLEDYSLPEADAKRVEKIQALLMQLDWDGIKDVLQT